MGWAPGGSPAGPSPTPWTSPPQRRYRFRNLSISAVRLRFYDTDDSLQLFTLPNGDKTINAGAELAYPEREFTGPLTLTVKTSDDIRLTMSAGQLLSISNDGSLFVSDYTPPPRDRRPTIAG